MLLKNARQMLAGQQHRIPRPSTFRRVAALAFLVLTSVFFVYSSLVDQRLSSGELGGPFKQQFTVQDVKLLLLDELMDNEDGGNHSNLCPESAFYRPDEGRMGNTFWELLSAWVVSTANNKPLMLSNVTNRSYRRYFYRFNYLTYEPLSHPSTVYAGDIAISCPRMAKHSNWLTRHQSYYDSDDRIHENAKKPFTKIIGYPHPTEHVMAYLFENRRRVLAQFRWKPQLIARVRARLNEYTLGRDYSTLVAIHSRRTDYENHLKVFWKGAKAAGPDYFARCQDYFRKKYEKPLFLVVSDDMDWCRKNLNGSDVVFAGAGEIEDPGHDMALLSQCDHLIMAYGTFAASAAYMIEGEILHAINFTVPEALDEFQTVLFKYRPEKWTFVPM